MPASRPSSTPSPTPRPRSATIPSPPSTRSSASSATASVDFVLADIPGLIEGAAEGAGVGDRFLGHIERTRVLLHLVDANLEDVASGYRTVRDELEAYGAGLADKVELIALNKADTIDAEMADALAAELRAESGGARLPVSGATGAGVDEMLDAIIAELRTIKQAASARSGGLVAAVTRPARPRRHRRHRLRRRAFAPRRARGRP